MDVFPIFVFGFFVIDGLQGTLTGILKGIEKKEYVTYTTLIVYYLIGIPLVIYFSFQFGLGMKVKGIWWAFAIANAALAIMYNINLKGTFLKFWEQIGKNKLMK